MLLGRVKRFRSFIRFAAPKLTINESFELECVSQFRRDLSRNATAQRERPVELHRWYPEIFGSAHFSFPPSDTESEVSCGKRGWHMQSGSCVILRGESSDAGNPLDHLQFAVGQYWPTKSRFNTAPQYLQRLHLARYVLTSPAFPALRVSTTCDDKRPQLFPPKLPIQEPIVFGIPLSLGGIANKELAAQ